MRYVNDPDIGKAAGELVANVRLLVIAGRFTEAHNALRLLLQDGPWKAKAHGRLRQELERLVPIVCWLARKPAPKIGESPAMAGDELEEWARGEEERYLDLAVTATRQQAGAADAGWSAEYFERLGKTPDRAACERELGKFVGDADFVFKARLAVHRPARSFFGISAADLRKTLGQLGVAPAGLEQLLGGAMGPPKVAPEAEKVSTMTIARAVARSAGAGTDYMVDTILRHAALIAIYDGAMDDAAECTSYLLPREGNVGFLVEMAVCGPVAQAFASGRFAAAAGVDPSAVPAFLSALGQRTQSVRAAAAKPKPLPADSPASFAAVLVNSPLRGREVVALPILDTRECAYAMALSSRDLEATWRAARELVAQTGRWPVAVWSHGERKLPLRERLLESELFSRFEYERAPDCDDVSPRALIAAAESVDVDEFLKRKADAREREVGIDEMLEWHLEDTQRRCGSAPSRADIAGARIDGAP